MMNADNQRGNPLKYHLLSPLMSRNAGNYENGDFGEIMAKCRQIRQISQNYANNLIDVTLLC